MKKKNILVGIGTIAVIAAPIAGVVSCSGSKSSKEVKIYNLLPTYTGHADQLLSLGIHPDYYPYQFDKTDVFGYIGNPKEYMIDQNSDFVAKFTKKVQSLLPPKQDRGVGWWNAFAFKGSDVEKDPTYWQVRGGNLVIYERYLLDDGAKVISESTAPKHFNNPRTYFETNFRESRDPFTRLPKIVLESLAHQDEYDKAEDRVKKIVNRLLDVARIVEGVSDLGEKAVDGKPRPSGLPKSNVVSDDISWLYNDYNFAIHYIKNKLHNENFHNSPFAEWEINTNDKNHSWVFDRVKENDDILKDLLFKSTYKEEEKSLELDKLAFDSYNYELNTGTGSSNTQAHHPIYEQQETIGGAPMFEGAQRENFLYFYTTAAQIQKAFTEPTETSTQADIDGYKKLEEVFKKDSGWEAERWDKLTHALPNAEKISREVKQRTAKIKKIVDDLRALESDKKIYYGIVTLAPGLGQSTIQCTSKYSLVYDEIGFDQPMPKNLKEVKPWVNAKSFFNMDDNGWWWNLGEGNNIAERSVQFNNQFDLGVVTAEDKQFNNLKDDNKDSLAAMFQTLDGKTTLSSDDLNHVKVEYNLWNEGLKTPFVVHMILDQIVHQLREKYVDTLHKDKQLPNLVKELEDAKDWGSYFTQDYIKGV